MERVVTEEYEWDLRGQCKKEQMKASLAGKRLKGMTAVRAARLFLDTFKQTM